MSCNNRGACNLDASGSSDDHGVVGYQWSYGDASANAWLTTAKTTHTYSRKGNYTIVLTVVDASGLQGTTQKSVNVKVQ